MIEKPDDQKICEGCLTPLTPFNSENSAFHWSEEWDVCDDCITTLDSDTAPATLGLHPYQGDPAGTKLDLDNTETYFDDHYLYSSDYRCELCNAPLWDEDEILRLKEVGHENF